MILRVRQGGCYAVATNAFSVASGGWLRLEDGWNEVEAPFFKLTGPSVFAATGQRCAHTDTHTYAHTYIHD